MRNLGSAIHHGTTENTDNCHGKLLVVYSIPVEVLP